MSISERLAWIFVTVVAGGGGCLFMFRAYQALSGGVLIGRGIRWDKSVQAKRFWAGTVLCLLLAPFFLLAALCALMMVFRG